MTLRALLTTTILCAGATAGAQTPPAAASEPAALQAAPQTELDALRKKVAALEARLDEAKGAAATPGDVQGVQADLENFKWQYQRDRETKSALSTRNLVIGAVVQARASWYGSDVTGTPASLGPIANTSVNNPAFLDDRSNTFAIPAAILSFNGLLYRDYESARNLGFSLSAGASPTATTNLAAASILDANVTYQLLPTIENDGARLSLTFGQALLPFGLESNTSEELKPVINNAQFVPQTGLGQRQIGLVARGEFFTQYDFGYAYRQALLAVAVGAVNGNGSNRDDDNARKDVVGRVAITIPAEYNSWLRELRLGGSVYLGRSTLTTTTGSGASATLSKVGTGTRNRYGADVYYNHFPLGVTYEYLRADEDVLSGSGATAQLVRQQRDSHTATVFYSFGEQFLRSIKTQGKFDDWWPKTWQPFLRYDRWVPDAKSAGGANDVYTAGLNVFFAETTKAQLNFNHRVQHVAGAADVGSDEVLAQLQFGF